MYSKPKTNILDKEKFWRVLSIESSRWNSTERRKLKKKGNFSGLYYWERKLKKTVEDVKKEGDQDWR